MESAVRKFLKKDKDIYITPKSGKHTETLVWMHGLGDSAEGWFDGFYSSISPVPETTKVVLLTAPTAPVTISFGLPMNSWFDMKGFDVSEETFHAMIGVPEIESNTKRIVSVLEDEIKELDGNSQKVFIGGFSQGACIALHAGLTFNKTLGGIIACSGFLFPIAKETKENANTPIYISHGEQDGTLPWKKCKPTYKKLENTAHNLTWVVEPSLGHSINDKVISTMKTFFKNALNK